MSVNQLWVYNSNLQIKSSNLDSVVLILYSYGAQSTQTDFWFRSLSVSRWNTARRGSASCWVTAPVVANQCDPASAGSVAAAAGEFRAWPWGFWYCPLPSPLSLLSSHCSSISLPLTPVDTRLQSFSSYCSHQLQPTACCVDVTYPLVSLTGVFVA